jgi:hypothetical protein
MKLSVMRLIERLVVCEDDMTELEQCATYRRDGEACTIACKLGLWSVTGKYSLSLINEAEHYFQQYKADGEYHELLGGDDPVTVLMGRI